jgi:DNA-binding SARP family transcriptional activator
MGTSHDALGVQVLGEFAVTVARRTVNPPAGKASAILALLALQEGRAVAASQLIEWIWGPEPPDNAASRLHVHISRLRRLLADLGAADCLKTRANAYLLAVDPEACDYHRFELGVSEGRAAVQAGEYAAAISAFTVALELWRGPALAEWAEQVWARGEVTRLTELRATAIQGWAHGLLALGRPEEAVPILEREVEENPLREEAVALLMLALYGTGQQAAALDVFSRTKRLLAEELGLDPSPRLQETYLGIIRQDDRFATPDTATRTSIPGPAGGPATPRLPVQATGDDGPREFSDEDGQHMVAMPVVELPARNPVFVGRNDVLPRIDQAFAARESDRPSVVVLVGLGGVGKSRVALEYAHESAVTASIVWWVPAGEPVGLVESLTQLADRLGISSGADQVGLLGRLWQELGRREGWTLVFDNCPDPDTLRAFSPPTGRGRVLLTSRHHAWRGIATILPVDVLPHEAALELLLTSTGQGDIVAAADLAGQLGGLPLALTQAAAYVDQTGMSLARYGAMFRRSRLALLSRALPEDYQASVVTTWRMSFDQVAERSSAAAELLQLCASLGPASIPLDLLIAAAPAVPGAVGCLLADELVLEDAIAELLRFSLISRADDAISLHPLVRAVLIERLPPVAQDELRLQAHRVLTEVAPRHPDDPAGWPSWAQWVPHAADLAERHETAGDHGLAVPLLAAAGHYLNARALYGPARTVLERAVRCAGTEYGPEGRETVPLLSDLGLVLEHLGEVSRARELQERALTLLDSAGDGATLEAAAVLHRLGGVLSCQRDVGQAMDALRQALVILTAAGPSRELGACLTDLAFSEWMGGLLTQAQDDFVRAIQIIDSTAGRGHPDAAHARSGLAVVLQDMGRLDDSYAIQREVVETMNALLGDQHPAAAHANDRLGHLLYLLGRPDESVAAHERALAILRTVYGPDHVELAMPLSNLGLVHLDAGRLDDAELCQRRARDLFAAGFGEHHPHTAMATRRLGLVAMARDDCRQAAELLRRSLDDTLAALGADHPDVACIRAELATCESVVA